MIAPGLDPALTWLSFRFRTGGYAIARASTADRNARQATLDRG
jgi:hypothetical protein